MTRITIKMLENQVKHLNKERKQPTTYKTDGKINVGHYHIGQSYGGVALLQTANTKGGVRAISQNGHGPKRELYMFLSGMLA